MYWLNQIPFEPVKGSEYKPPRVPRVSPRLRVWSQHIGLTHEIAQLQPVLKVRELVFHLGIRSSEFGRSPTKTTDVPAIWLGFYR